MEKDKLLEAIRNFDGNNPQSEFSRLVLDLKEEVPKIENWPEDILKATRTTRWAIDRDIDNLL